MTTLLISDYVDTIFDRQESVKCCYVTVPYCTVKGREAADVPLGYTLKSFAYASQLLCVVIGRA